MEVLGFREAWLGGDDLNVPTFVLTLPFFPDGPPTPMLALLSILGTLNKSGEP